MVELKFIQCFCICANRGLQDLNVQAFGRALYRLLLGFGREDSMNSQSAWASQTPSGYSLDTWKLLPTALGFLGPP